MDKAKCFSTQFSTRYPRWADLHDHSLNGSVAACHQKRERRRTHRANAVTAPSLASAATAEPVSRPASASANGRFVRQRW
jgi:hypothetical protein